jgi:hypothetical protein
MLELSSALPRQRPRHPHPFDAQTSILIYRTNRADYSQKWGGPPESRAFHTTQALIGPFGVWQSYYRAKCQNGWYSYAAWALYAASALPDGVASIK